MSLATLLLFISVVALIWHFLYSGKGKWRLPLPPSPSYRLPILGHILHIDPDLRKTLSSFRKDLGNIYSLYFGSRLVIVLGGYDTIKEAFHKNGDVFANRPKMHVFEKITRGMGLANTNGTVWRDHRRFTLSTLKDFGMGKSKLEKKIHNEVKSLLAAIETENGKPFNPKDILCTNVANIICSIVFGGNFKHGDQRFLRLMNNIDEVMSNGKNTALAQFFPVLTRLPGDPLKMNQMMKNSDEVFAFTIELIDEHVEEYDENIIEDFTSAYIKEMNNLKRLNQETNFSYEQLSAVIADLIMTGSETLTTTIRWSIACLVNYPDKQERMFKEIMEHVGLERIPLMEDKNNLTYVEAFYMEVLRFCNITITGVLHSTTRDIEFRGYTLPKGTIIMPDFHSVFSDEKIWGDPTRFRPERFLDGDGKLQKPDELIVFSVGKRNCVGESLAKMELFLFLSALVQKFKFECPDGECLSMDVVDGEFGVVHGPKPYKIIARPR